MLHSKHAISQSWHTIIVSTTIMYRVISALLLMLAIISADDTNKWVGFGRKCNKFAPEGTPGTACNPEKNFACLFGACSCQPGSKYDKANDECSAIMAKSLGSVKYSSIQERKLLGSLAEIEEDSPMLRKIGGPSAKAKSNRRQMQRMFSVKDVDFGARTLTGKVLESYAAQATTEKL